VADAPVCVILPEVEREPTVVDKRVVVPPVCVMLPEEASDVWVPILVMLFWVGVAMVPVSVDPDTSLDAATDPVTVKLPPVMAPPVALTEPAFTVAAVTALVAVRFVAVTVPSKAVVPTDEDPILVNTFETGSPLTVRLVQLILVAATSTASMFFTTALIVVGTYRGL